MPTTSAPTIHDPIYAPSIPELIRQMRGKGQTVGQILTPGAN